MRIHLKRLVLMGACIMALLGLLAVGANAYTYPSMPSNWEDVEVTVGTVTMPFASYPTGAYFDPDKSTMTVEEQQQYGFNLGRTLDLRGWECVAFARYAYAALFYKYPQDASIDTSLAYGYSNNYAYVNMIEEVLGTRTLSPGYSASTLKTLFTSCKPGAVMRVGGHSMVLMAIFDDGCLIYDANYSSDNEVSVRKYTWDSFVSTFGGREMSALQMPAYYPGYSYSTGGSDDGYDIDTSTAGVYEVYNCTELNVRVRPSTSATRVGSLTSGTMVQVIGTYNGWAKINYQNVLRWASMDYLRIKPMDVTVTFDANGGQASYSSATYQAGDAFGSLPTATKSNRTFAAWSDNGTIYTESSTVPSVSTLLLKAQWCILDYRDVLETDWYASYVEEAYNRGLISRDSQFSPDRSASRCEVVTVLGREYERETGDEIANSGNTGYSDVPSNSYYAPYVAWGTDLGIVKGMGGDIFDPDRSVTKEQIAVFLYRFGVYRGVITESQVDSSVLQQFDDGSSVSDYAVNAVSWAVHAGILKGNDQNCLNPQSPAKRSEMITMFTRYIDYSNQNPPVEKTVTVTFDANGGTSSEGNRTCTVGASIGQLPSVTKNNRVLIGWFNGDTEYTADSPAPESDITLTARWCVLGYTDVPEDVWYAPYVEKCYEYGMLELSEQFLTDAMTARSEVVTMLGRSYEKQTGTTIPQATETGFVDVDLSADYARFVMWGHSIGLVKGITETEFRPDQPVLRSQVSLFLYRMACYTGAITDEDRDVSNLLKFVDGDQVNETYQKAMSWAVEAGILLGNTDGALLPESPVTHAQVVAMMTRYLEYVGA